MRILLINQYAGSTKHGMEYRPYYLAREWVRQGHHVEIVAGTPSHVRSKEPEPETSGRLSSEVLDGICYWWIRLPAYSGNGPKRAINIFSFVGWLMVYGARFARECKPDVVIASSTHPLDTVAARMIARRSGAKLVFELHDLWPLSPIELGGMSPGHPFIRVMQWAENFTYRHVDHVISMLPNALGHMREHGLPEGRFSYVPNGISLDEWSDAPVALPEEHARSLKELREQGAFVVMYAGAHGVANALDAYVRAASELRDTPARLVLVGQGPEKPALQQLAQEVGVENVLFLPHVPKAAVPTLLREADLLYIGLKRCSLFRFGISPNKLMDYMMAGKPVIQAIEAGNNIVVDAECGIAVIPEDPHAIAEAVRDMAGRSPEERARLGENGRRYVLANHEYQTLGRRSLEILSDLTRQRPSPARSASDSLSDLSGTSA